MGRIPLTVLLAGSLALAAACGKKDGPKGGEKSASITPGLSDSGGTQISAGECISFTINGENTGFAAGDVAVDLNFNDGEVAVVVPETHVHVISQSEIKVGLPDEAPAVEPCWCFGPGLHPACQPVPTGNVDISVRDGSDIIRIEDAFDLEPLDASDATVDTPIAASLNRLGDTDYYVTSVPNTVIAVVSAPNGDESFLPATFGYTEDYEGLLAVGGRAAIRDLSDAGTSFDYKTAVSGYLLEGGAGFDYQFQVQEFAAPVDYSTADVAAVDRWDDGTMTAENPGLMELSEGLFLGAVGQSLTGGPAVNNYNPNPNSDPNDEQTWGPGCPSQDDELIDPGAPRHFPILGRGRDVVYKYVAPADGDVLIAVQSEGTGSSGTGDFLVYVVEDPANDLPDGSDGTCLAGSDLFSDRATDSLVFTATGGNTYYVFVDLFADVSGDQFLLLLEEL